MTTRFVYALLLFAFMGLDQPNAAAATSSLKSTAQPPAKAPGDAQIEHAIRAKLAKSKLSADHFTVSVTKGVATIEGSTSVMQHKGAMTRIAKTSGATSVRNNIRIADAARAKATAALAKGRAASLSPVAAAPPDQPTVIPASIPRATVLPSTSQR